MPTNQESFFQAGLIINLVVADLEGSFELGIPMWDAETVDTCDRLRTASQIIRDANGGTG
jgi:hypothetical protein